MILNRFDWFKDGESKSGFFEFGSDGTYQSNFASGTWEVIDKRTFWKKNTNGDLYTIRFIDDFGEDAILISPARNPPSRLRLNQEKATGDTTPSSTLIPIKTEGSLISLNFKDS